MVAGCAKAYYFRHLAESDRNDVLATPGIGLYLSS